MNLSLNPPLRHWQGRRVWIVGASSGIGRATASLLHARGAQVIVSARNAQALQAFVAAHPGSQALPCDATDPAQVQRCAAQVLAAGTPTLVCYCAGTYQPLRANAWDLGVMQQHLAVNYTGALHLLDAVLPALRTVAAQGQAAHISLVGSVAGFRGLPQGLAYGPTKAALIHLAEVLYLDLRPLGLGVSIVNPGFVETPLTAGNDFRMPALLEPEAAAAAVVRGWEQGRFHIHFPRRFTNVLLGLRLLPYRAYFAVVRRFTGL
jgi:NAD(P)-dependent dehydrogenase (short-subunit alcohol dehydrogenase family)